MKHDHPDLETLKVIAVANQGFDKGQWCFKSTHMASVLEIIYFK